MLSKVQELAEGTNKNVRLLFSALIDFQTGRTTRKELDEYCYSWSYHYALDDMCYKPIPSMPYNVIEFYELSYKQRQKLMDEDFKVKIAVVSFRDEESKIKNINKSNKMWLKSMLKYFEEKNDYEKIGKIREVLSKWGD